MPTPRTPLGVINGNSRKGKELTPHQRALIKGAAKFYDSTTLISATFDIAELTVRSTISAATTRIDSKSQLRSSRPPKFLDRDYRKLLRLIRRNPKWTYRKVIKEFAVLISKSTV